MARTTTLIRRAWHEPGRIAPYVLRRIAPRSRFGPQWVARPDGFVTFREQGFVAAPGPIGLLARHNWETAAIRAILGTGVPAARSLEIGCGFGRLSPTFADFSLDHTAVDINASALAAARSAYPRLQFTEASATDLKFEDGSFDLVTTWTVLQHLPPAAFRAAVDEIVRVAGPVARLLLCEETRHPDQVTPHTWHRSAETYVSAFHGFELVHEDELEEIERIPDLRAPGHLMLFARR